jgi:hypothetical protein
MTHPDPDNELVRNPNDPWRREWGTGSAVVVAVVTMADIIAYGASVAGYF